MGNVLVNPYIFSAFTANAVNFDGTNDYLTRGADYTGSTDSKLWTASNWIKTTAGGQQIILEGDANSSEKFAILSGNISIRAENSSGATIAVFEGSGNNLDDGNWHWIAFSFDLTDLGKRHVRIDDSSAGGSWTTYTDDTIDFTKPEHFVGARVGAADKFNGDMSELYHAPDQYIDLDTLSNEEKFRLDSKPVDLGIDGSTPTGVAAILYLTGPTDAWHTNKGSGGGMTENGTLTTASTSPSD